MRNSRISEVSLINAYVALFSIAIGITVAAKLSNEPLIDTIPKVKFESLTFTRSVGTCNVNTISGVTEYIEERNGGPVVYTPDPIILNRPEKSLSYTKLNKTIGTVTGPSGKETYYNLKMSGVIKLMKGDQ